MTILRHFHTATVANTTGMRTELDIPSANGRSDAVLFALTFAGPQSWQKEPEAIVVLNPNQIGVQYIRSRQRWHIVNLNGAPIPIGARFHVTYVINDDTMAFVHRTRPSNVSGDFTFIPEIADRTKTLDLRGIEVLLQVTPQVAPIDSITDHDVWWSMPGVSFPRLPTDSFDFDSLDPRLAAAVTRTNLGAQNHPIGVWYNERLRTWTIANLDAAPMNYGLRYNVFITNAHGSGTDHRGICVSGGLEGSSQTFCLTPCDAFGTAFAVTVNMSYPYFRGAGYQVGSCSLLELAPRRCRSPLAAGVHRKLFRNPNAPLGKPTSYIENTFILYQDMMAIPAGVGFNVYHSSTQ